MSDFVTLKSIIINRNEIRQILITQDVEQTYDYDYKDGLRTTNIYVHVQTTDQIITITYRDEEWEDFKSFVKEFYRLESWKEISDKACDLISDAPIQKHSEYK